MNHEFESSIVRRVVWPSCQPGLRDYPYLQEFSPHPPLPSLNDSDHVSASHLAMSCRRVITSQLLPQRRVHDSNSKYLMTIHDFSSAALFHYTLPGLFRNLSGRLIGL